MSNSHWAQERGGFYRKREDKCDTFKAKESSVQGVGQEGMELCPGAWTPRAMGNYVRVLNKDIILIHVFIHPFIQQKISGTSHNPGR